MVACMIKSPQQPNHKRGITVDDIELEITLNPATDALVESFVWVIEKQGARCTRSDRPATNIRKAEGIGPEVVTTLVVWAGVAVLRHLSPVVVAYFRAKAAGRIEIKVGTTVIRVANETQLNSAVDTVAKIQALEAKRKTPPGKK